MLRFFTFAGFVFYRLISYHFVSEKYFDASGRLCQPLLLVLLYSPSWAPAGKLIAVHSKSEYLLNLSLDAKLAKPDAPVVCIVGDGRRRSCRLVGLSGAADRIRCGESRLQGGLRRGTTSASTSDVELAEPVSTVG
ncbi:MAG: hypothetical protein WCA49_09685 [Candidatus Sulfotelmatobacter sp.]